ncbi:hypothetical protein BH11BAC3_BH11BAC3_39170 [soil metagenome]
MNKRIVPEKMEWSEGRVKNFFGKELIALQNGSLKLIKIAPFASYPEHNHPDKTEYAYVLEGHPDFSIGDEYFSGQPADFFIFTKNEKHAIFNKTGVECLLLIGAINESLK